MAQSGERREEYDILVRCAACGGAARRYAHPPSLVAGTLDTRHTAHARLLDRVDTDTGHWTLAHSPGPETEFYVESEFRIFAENGKFMQCAYIFNACTLDLVSDPSRSHLASLDI